MFLKFIIGYTVFQIVAILSQDYFPADVAVYEIAPKKKIVIKLK